VLECVVNVSEGRDQAAVAAIAAAAGSDLLDVHTDPDHHRSVLTLVGEEAPRAVTVEAVARLDLTEHVGAHPRFGVVDVVPFVPLAGADLADAERARDEFARWAAVTLDLPCFLYGPDRDLPTIRRRAFVDLAPDAGPAEPHPTAGAVAVGARLPLVAYNLWVDASPAEAREIARSLRGPAVRALAFALASGVQVSCNLVDPERFGPAQARDAVAERAHVRRAELVGLLPESVLRSVPAHRWTELDLDADRTIEARLEARR
jgi:glutamate formiminotransferase / 5-formyltetrahydrofolate cyclo-ligase